VVDVAVGVPGAGQVPADPTVEQLVELLAERDRLPAERAKMIVALTARVAELEAR
jgi:hypothetical protein